MCEPSAAVHQIRSSRFRTAGPGTQELSAYHLQHDREAFNSALRSVLDAVKQHLHSRCPGTGPKARTGTVAFIPRFGSSLNQHPHFHVDVIDGLFEPDPERGARFVEAEALDPEDAEAVQTQDRRRLLRAFVRRWRLEKEDRQEMEQWEHGGGFSLDASVRIETHERHGLERLLRDCARPPPFAAERMEELDAQRLIYHLPKPGSDGRTQQSCRWNVTPDDESRYFHGNPLPTAAPSSSCRRWS